MDNPEKLATLSTQDEDKQNKKHNTIIKCRQLVAKGCLFIKRIIKVL